MQFVEHELIPPGETGFSPTTDVAVFQSLINPDLSAKAEVANQYLLRRGLLTGSGVVQIDIAAVTKKTAAGIGHDRALCDHNCGLEGGYDCPARIFSPANRGLKRKDLAPASQLVKAIITATKGIQKFNQRFLADLDQYGQLFQVPEQIKIGIAQCLLANDFSVNIFGGNAEMHPDALAIAQACHQLNLRTTLTTTGGILLKAIPESQAFLTELLTGSVDVLAVTAEYANPDQIKKLFAMNPTQLREAWKSIPPSHGQLRKGIETIYVLQLKEKFGEAFPQPLLNLVVHRGILGPDGQQIEDIISTLKECVPTAKINPYPAQSFRKHQSDQLSFLPEDVPALQQFIARRRQEQAIEDPQVVMRPHYYDMLEAVMRSAESESEAARLLSGEDTWRCYEQRHGLAGAGQVVQIGASPHERDLSTFPNAGGYLACFWDDTTITHSANQVWDMTAAEVAHNIDGGMKVTASHLNNTCKGCLMPRLNGDVFVTELGLLSSLKSAYLEARKETVGY